MKVQQKFLMPLIAIGISLLIGSILIMLTGNNFTDLIIYIFKATVGNKYNMGQWLMVSSLLTLTGLSVAFAYKANIINIGAEGQFMVGSLAATVSGIYLNIPSPFHAIISLMIGITAGALYALIPALLKAYYKVHEVVVTIMLNWIALYYINFLITNILSSETSNNQTETIKESSSIVWYSLTSFFDSSRFHYGIILAIFAILIYWIIFEKTKYGYEIKIVGQNIDAAKYAGINEKKVLISSFLISGGLAGLAGAIYALGAVDYLSTAPVFRNYGFDGISVAFLGNMNGIYIACSALFLGALRNAGRLMIDVPSEIIDIVIGIILMLSVSIPVIIKKITRKDK